MRRPQFSVQTMVVAVAALALGLVVRDASDQFRPAPAPAPTPAALCDMAEKAASARRYGKATDLFEQAVAADSYTVSVRASEGLSRVAARTGDYGRLISAVTRAIEAAERRASSVDPWMLSALYIDRASARINRGDRGRDAYASYSGALEDLRRAERLVPHVTGGTRSRRDGVALAAHLGLGDIRREAGDRDGAARHYSDARRRLRAAAPTPQARELPSTRRMLDVIEERLAGTLEGRD